MLCGFSALFSISDHSAVLPSDGRRKGLWQCRSVSTRSPVGRCVAVVGVENAGQRDRVKASVNLMARRVRQLL
jgi:hypothetical protein